MFKEFREFINKGNVIDMAVGLMMAVYFGAIAKSFVDDILMPPIGQLLAGFDFSFLKIVIKEGAPAVMNGDVIVTPEVKEVAINIGVFINHIITFFVVSWAAFMVVKTYNKMRRKHEAAPAPPPAPSAEEKLLTEIRDLLREK